MRVFFGVMGDDAYDLDQFTVSLILSVINLMIDYYFL